MVIAEAEAPTLGRLALIVAIFGYIGLVVSLFWAASWGGLPALVLGVVLAAVSSASQVMIAARYTFSARHKVTAATLVMAQVLVAGSAVQAGRTFVRHQVVSRLDEYDKVAAAARVKLARSQTERVALDHPHPDIYRANATRHSDGSVVVMLSFNHAPRHVRLYEVSGRKSMPHEPGLCLEHLRDGWYWRRKC